MRSVLSSAASFLAIDAQVLVLVERLAKELAQFRIDRLRVVVAQKTERGIDFLFEHLAVGLGKGRQHLDEQREQVRALGHRPRLAHQTAAHVVRQPAHPPQRWERAAFAG